MSKDGWSYRDDEDVQAHRTRTRSQKAQPKKADSLPVCPVCSRSSFQTLTAFRIDEHFCLKLGTWVYHKAGVYKVHGGRNEADVGLSALS